MYFAASRSAGLFVMLDVFAGFQDLKVCETRDLLFQMAQRSMIPVILGWISRVFRALCGD